MRSERDEMFFEDLGESKVDVRYDHRLRAISDMSQPAMIAGRAAVLHIPFTGDPQLLQLRTNSFTYSPPRAGVKGRDIVAHVSWPSDTARPNRKAQAEQLAQTIEQWMAWSRDAVEAYNGELEKLARETIQSRRERVLADHAHLDNLGIPVRHRSDAPETYAAPGITRTTPPAAIEAGWVSRRPPIQDAVLEEGDPQISCHVRRSTPMS